VSELNPSGGPGQRRRAPMYSLAPLIALSLLVAVLLTQSAVTLAYPSFQSPVQQPTHTPAVVPTEPAPGPPGETPVVPPGETPVVPPGESPVVPPGETPVLPPGVEATPSARPEATPGEEASPQAPTPTGAAGEEGSSLLRGLSPAVLIDTCVVGLSSVWLCCGGFALVVFVLLVIASFLLRVS
jgi:hypothetical protein